MSFLLRQIAIHELIKDSEQAEANLFLSQQLSPTDEMSSQLVEKLNDIFDQKSDTLQGVFSTPEDALFPGYYHDLVEEDFSSEAFLSFSRESMQALQLSLQGVVGAKGGYLVYCDYESFDLRFLGVFLIRDTEGIVFKRKNTAEGFDIENTIYLNTDKLAMAGRINTTKFIGGNDRCLELIKHTKSQKTISEYFINWIGLDQPESSKQLTTTFLQAVDELPLPVKPEQNSNMSAEEFKEEVINFAMTRPHKIINLQEFDNQFYEGTPTAQNFMNDNEVPLEQEFRFDQNTLKRYYQVKAGAQGMYLSFNKNDLQAGRVIIEDDQIIIKNDLLLEKLLEQL
ncbi:MAG: nucleoid-associated protein [Bacteroidota bacterium]